MLTVGHHTCKIDGGEEIVLKDSPFLAEHLEDAEPPKYQFLGTGYYFWDNNIDLAKWWGEKHYNNSYYIIEIDIVLEENSCFDLLGNRKHQIFIQNFLNTVSKFNGDEVDWSISKCIEFFKEANTKVDTDFYNVFPYKTIRAIDIIDLKEEENVIIQFVKSKPNKTHIRPRIAICAIDKNNLNLESKRFIR